jgi:hypothetical protein
MSDNPKPETYGPKCGGVNPQDDAIKCQQQTNKSQANMSGGQNKQVEVPVADNGGVEANSPQNNESNAADLTGGLNQAKADAKYDNQVGDRNVDNSAGAGGGRKRKRKTRKRSQKSRRRKVFVGCNRRSRKRTGGKTKKLSGWGCMSGGKRKTRKFKKHYMWNTKGKRYMAKTYKQHLRGKKLGHTHTKPKRKTRKTRRSRRRGGNMTPGSPEHTAELNRRIKAAREKRSGKSKLSVLQDRDKREEQEEGVGLFTKALTNMQLEKNKNQQRQSLPNMSTTSDNYSPDVRSRSYTSGF